MGRRQQKVLNKTKKKAKHNDSTGTGQNNNTSTADTKNQDQHQKHQIDGGSWLYADPERIRYQHSRIRPYFSGCGRSVQETFESIRDGKMSFTDLPPIQVIVGPSECNLRSSSSTKKNRSQDNNSPWYFSLNNRRLWVLKKCRAEGLLEHVGNVVRVRVRECKSVNESKRYTLENCALTAKFLRERPRNRTAIEEDGHGNGFGVGGDSDDMKEEGLLKGEGIDLLSVGDDAAKRCGVSENADTFTSRTHCGNDDENLDTDEFQSKRDGRDIDSDDRDESEEVITSKTPSYRNPFCIDSDSSSSEDGSV